MLTIADSLESSSRAAVTIISMSENGTWGDLKTNRVFLELINWQLYVRPAASQLEHGRPFDAASHLIRRLLHL
jgi:hypothetical protein